MCICQRGLLEKSAEGNLSRPSNPDVQPIKWRQAMASDILKKCYFRENSWTRKAKIDLLKNGFPLVLKEL